MPVSIYMYHGRHVAGWYYLVCLPDCLPVLGVVFSVAYKVNVEYTNDHVSYSIYT